jgi:hypothetical protein
LTYGKRAGWEASGYLYPLTKIGNEFCLYY